MSRSKKKLGLVPFTFTSDPLFAEKLDRRAAALRRSRSWIIREALARYLAEPLDTERRAPRGSLL